MTSGENLRSHFAQKLPCSVPMLGSWFWVFSLVFSSGTKFFPCLAACIYVYVCTRMRAHEAHSPNFTADINLAATARLPAHDSRALFIWSQSVFICETGLPSYFSSGSWPAAKEISLRTLVPLRAALGRHVREMVSPQTVFLPLGSSAR